MCPAVNTGENSVRIFALVTDFRPEFNDDFGAAKLSGAGADTGIVQTMLGDDRTPVYNGPTPTTSGAVALPSFDSCTAQWLAHVHSALCAYRESCFPSFCSSSQYPDVLCALLRR